MAVWVVRVKRHEDERLPVALDKGILTIGWAWLSNLSRFRDQDNIKQQHLHHSREQRPAVAANYARQVWDFGHIMTLGDLVVMRLDAEVVAVGTIESDYFHRGDAPGNARHAMPPELVWKLSAEQTIFRLGTDEDAARIREAVEAHYAARG
jgi:predicted Mrr-cat superfamily restriction endonuclease